MNPRRPLVRSLRMDAVCRATFVLPFRYMSDPSTARAEGSDERDAALAGLLAECAHGDGHAFELFYKATARRTLVTVRAIAGSPYAEDVLSDTYLQVWRDS